MSDLQKSADNKPSKEAEMSFLDHLEELRWHIIRSLIAIVSVAIVVFLMDDLIFDKIIFGPKKEWFPTYHFFCDTFGQMCAPPDFQIIPRELGEIFFTHLKVSFWLGLIVSFPYIFWEFWRFIKPGLYAHERKAIRGIVFICSVLFFTGILFGYYVIAPFGVSFLGSYTVSEEAFNGCSLASYVSYMTMFTIPTGLVFELPILVYFLAKVGLITPEFMAKYRKHSLIVILILAAVITPPDLVTQILIGIPVYFLYEVSIIIAKRVAKNNKV